MLHALDIAGMVCPNNLFLAPMAGYTNDPFRRMCEQLGAGLTFTEMVSAKGLHYGSEETKLLLYHDPSSRPPAAQIFGSDPDIMREACESEALKDFGLIDINMGCPMPKIVKNGDGSALMENPALAEKVISACVKSGKRISVKFRTGIDGAHKITAEFAKRCEGAGAVMLTIHGRTRDKIYAGPCDHEEIAAAKRAVKVPVIANGGVSGLAGAREMFEKTGADGVMIARAALYDPRVFCAVTGREAPPLTEIFSWQLAETKRIYGERFATLFMRKMAAFYIKGKPGSAAYKVRLFSARSTEETLAIAQEAFL